MVDIKHGKMKAVRWEGHPESVSVKEIDIPKIKAGLDIIVKVTTAGICGTDLHTFHGRVPMTVPLTFGHEVVGIVEEIGPDVTTVKKGDRVVVLDIDEHQNEDADLEYVALFGIGKFGDFPQMNGGQAQFMHVPNADDNVLLLPPGHEHELDYVLLADIWPTAWWALDAAEMVFGDTVAVFGAGPVGLLCAYSAILRGATRVYSIDHVPERLARAKSIGAIPINFSEVNVIKHLAKLEPNGVDRSCDCVGFECVDADNVNRENLVINDMIAVTKQGGGIGLIGVYTSNDLKGTSPEAAKGRLVVDIGKLWLKGISIRGGVIPPTLNRPTQELLKVLIDKKGAQPSFVFDREFRIDEAEEAFLQFSQHKITKGAFKFDRKERHRLNGDHTEEPLKKRARRS